MVKLVLSTNVLVIHNEMWYFSRVNEQWRAEAGKYKQWAEQWQQYQLAQVRKHFLQVWDLDPF